MKRDGFVYEPVPGKPCAYIAALEFEQYVSSLFGDDRESRSSPDNLQAMCRFLASYQHLTDFPQYAPDNNLLSFENGVLDITDMTFVPYDEVVDGHPLLGRTARHHVPRDWSGEEETPVLDSILR